MYKSRDLTTRWEVLWTRVPE